MGYEGFGSKDIKPCYPHTALRQGGLLHVKLFYSLS